MNVPPMVSRIAGHLVLDQGAETEPEEPEQDGGGDQPGHDGPELVGDVRT